MFVILLIKLVHARSQYLQRILKTSSVVIFQLNMLPPRLTSAPQLRAVLARDGSVKLGCPHSNANAVSVACRVGSARVDPDGPRVVVQVRAGDETGAVESEVVVGIESEVAALAVGAHGLSASGVLEDTLAHARCIDVGGLERSIGAVQAHGTIDDITVVTKEEGGDVGGRVAGGVLVCGASHDAALVGLEGLQVNV